MLRIAARMMVFMAGVVAVAGIASGLSAQDKGPSIKQIMKAMNGPKGFVAKTVDAGKAGNWDEAAKYGSKAAECAAALGKNTPKKGDAASWEMLTKKYAQVGADIEAAAKAKDLDKLQDAAKTFGAACKNCHSMHK
jgi:cytochrome c556